jgi:hypothetical protein
MAVFWDVAPYSLVVVNRRFRAVIVTEAVSSSEMSVIINQTTKYNVPEDSRLQRVIFLSNINQLNLVVMESFVFSLRNGLNF